MHFKSGKLYPYVETDLEDASNSDNKPPFDIDKQPLMCVPPEQLHDLLLSYQTGQRYHKADRTLLLTAYWPAASGG